MKNKKTLILVLILFILSSIFLYKKYFAQKEHVITLKETGFYPAGIKIEKGETVTFKNETSESFWPASDIHPTHEVYSDFDPKRALKAEEEWSFTFNQVGTWRYHDHISPIYRGTIEVVGEKALTGGARDEKKAKEVCDVGEEQERVRCWVNFIQNVVLEDGPEKALDITKKLREEDPRFAVHCHTFVHNIGEVAYWKYVEDGKLLDSGKVSLCGYGYLHGFMQEIGHHDINFIANANKLCDFFTNDIDYEGYEEIVEPRDQCYHGVGHGLSFLFAPDYWEDEIKIVDKGLEACKKLAENPIDLNNCSYGLFGGLTGLYTGGHGFKMEMDTQEPFGVCEAQPDEFKEACYDSMVPALWVETERDLSAMVRYFSKVKDISHLGQAMYNFGDIVSPRFVLGETGEEDIISTCQSLRGSLSQRCIEGFSEGIIRNGFPETAPKKAEDFCNSELLTSSQKDVCFGSFISEMKLAYSQEKFNDICSNMAENVRNYCN